MALNFQDVIRDVHNPSAHALQTTGSGNSTVYIGTPTLYAVVNTSAAGQASVVLDAGVSNIGFATVSVSNPTLYAVVNTSASNAGNTTLNPSPNFIGIVTVANSQSNTGNVTLNSSPNQIGSVTVSNPITLDSGTANVGFATVSVSNSVGNATLNPSPNYIGLVTANIGTTKAWSDPNTFICLATVVIGAGGAGFQTVFQGGSPWNSIVTVANKDRTITGNLTLSDSKSFVGLVSVSGFANPLPVDATGQGDVPVTLGGEEVVLGAGANFAGIVTVANPSAFSGNVTLDPGSKTQIAGNLTLSDSKSFIGLTTVTGSDLDIRSLNSTATLYAVVNTSAAGQASVVIDGNVTLSDPKGFIGLTTVTGSDLDIRSLNSTATLYAVVNTSAAGQASVVLDSSPNFIGIVTVTNKDRTITGNLTLSDSKTYVGLTTTTLGVGTRFIGLVTANSIVKGNVTLSDSKGFIGLTTVTGSALDIRSLNSTATLFAVVNTSAAGQASVVLDDGISSIGFATVNVVNTSRSILGNLTLSDPKGFIGLATVNIGSSNATLFAVVNTAAAGQASVVIDGNVTISDSKSFIGLVSVSGFANPLPVDATGQGDVPVTLGGEAVSVAGNLTLSDSKAGIGLVSVFGGSLKLEANSGVDIGDVDVTSNTAWADPNTYIGLTTSTIGNTPTVFVGTPTLFAVVNTAAAGQSSIVIDGNVTLSDAKTYVGLTTTTLGVGTRFVGLVTANSIIKGNVTLSDAKTGIGLVSVFGGSLKLEANSGVDIGDVDVTSNTAWSDPNTHIGLVTATEARLSTPTVFTAIYSATGNNTLFVAPASNFYYVNDLMVGSLGNSEVKFMEEGTDIIEYISLATKSGFSHHYGEGINGLRAGTANKSFVAALNGAATISVMTKVTFHTS